MHNEVWGCAETLPKDVLHSINLCVLGPVPRLYCPPLSKGSLVTKQQGKTSFVKMHQYYSRKARRPKFAYGTSESH